MGFAGETFAILLSLIVVTPRYASRTGDEVARPPRRWDQVTEWSREVVRAAVKVGPELNSSFI